MSTSSLPRKPSATSDAASKPTKPLTPSLQKSSSGKENPPRATSRPRASSVTRTKVIPRIDKPSGRVEARGGARGRSASPSQFSRVLSDLRKGVSRVETDRKSVQKSSVDRRISEKGVSRVEIDRKSVDTRISEKGVSIERRNVEKVSVDGRISEKGVSIDRKNVEKVSVDGRISEKGVSINRKNVEKLSVDGRISEKGRRVSEKSDKNGGFVGDLKLGEDKKFGSRGERNRDGNSVCSSSIGIRLNDGIGWGDKGRVLEGLKFKKYVEKGVGLLGMKESRLNGDVDLGVSDSIELKSGGESSLDGNVEMSEVSGGVKETEMRLSVQDSGESLGLNDLTGNRKVDLSEKDHVIEEVQVRASGEKSDKLISKGLRAVGRAGVSSCALKDKAVIEEGKGSTLSAKRYPSKLHEKLAFLEGKVKKIASDIKQTKEMLDLNNPDASKVILSDIQEKISGIEKAMGNVVGVGNANVKLLKEDGNDEGKVTESIEHEEGQIGDGKRSVKGLSVHELEARLFPHHKLLKDRTCLKSSSEISQLDESREVESIQNQKPRDKARSSIDENPVALEFLEALKNGHSVEDKNEDTENSEDAATENNSASLIACQNNFDFSLTANEKLDEYGEQEHTSRMVIDEENEKSCAYMLKEIGHKISTGGWFVSEGEAVLLSHDDGSCSYYDITNCEGKAEYKPPVGTSPNMWRDCWIVRAPSSDGCSGRYVVAASAGNSFEAGFCSWDFYTKDVRAFHSEDGTAYVRTALADLPNNTMHRRNALSSTSSPDHQQWFYRPCGPLIVSTASCQRSVKVYDIRDGEHVMRWELQKPVATMEYSSPLQWRNRGKVVVAEADTISLWDVSSLSPQPLLSVSSCNRKISALHVNNTDAELGGGVRQRVSSSEVEGNDGVFCTADSINVLDFRQPSGIGLEIPKVGVDVQSAFSCGDSVLLGCTSLKSVGKKQFSSQIQQFSLRKQRLVSTYVLPDSNAHAHHKAITQVWGNSNLVMGVCGLGLCIYDSSKDKGLLPYTTDTVQMNNAKDVIGPNDLYFPSFDYLASRVLLISRDRPALWRYVS